MGTDGIIIDDTPNLLHVLTILVPVLMSHIQTRPLQSLEEVDYSGKETGECEKVYGNFCNWKHFSRTAAGNLTLA